MAIILHAPSTPIGSSAINGGQRRELAGGAPCCAEGAPCCASEVMGEIGHCSGLESVMVWVPACLDAYITYITSG